MRTRLFDPCLGPPGRTRTPNPPVRSRALFQLSYERWGDRGELHPRPPGSQPGALLLSYGHRASPGNRTQNLRIKSPLLCLVELERRIVIIHVRAVGVEPTRAIRPTGF